MTENENAVRMIARGCNERQPIDYIIRETLIRLNEGMERTAEGVETPDWNKVIILRTAIASAVGLLEASELHV